MKITLARNWFGPDGTLRKAHIVHEVPNEWEKQLPPGAKISEEVVETKPLTKTEELKAKAAAEAKAKAEAEAKAKEEAEAKEAEEKAKAEAAKNQKSLGL